MRMKAGEQPRTMGQKILAAHCDDDSVEADLVEVRIDQVVLAREPNRILGAAVEAGLTSAVPEVCIAYPPYCVTVDAEDSDPKAPHRVPHEALTLGFLVAHAGAGFASAVHLERFGSPTRLVLSDDPRLSSCGAAGMLTIPASRSQLSEAILSGKTQVRPPRSICINLTGRLRPFVCVRDIALELQRRGLEESIIEADAAHHAPVVLEFGGPSSKFLSVADRAVLCALAPQLGAAGALFPSDDKTEIFLRDQRRSKAHRALYPDAGAPFDDVLTIDLAAIEPLIMDEKGRIRPVRELDGLQVSQVLLGGDTGISLRDLLAASSLLKSKRVDPAVEFLLCPPSRQTLEVLARGEALTDFLATGARLIEPDRRALSGNLYRTAESGARLRNADRESDDTSLVASAETLAYAVAHGEVGDPRKFKRPVRVTVPRSLPTDDVLLVRGKDARGGARGKGRVDKRAEESAAPVSSDSFAPPPLMEEWDGTVELALSKGRNIGEGASAVVADCLDDLLWLAENAAEAPGLRAIVANHIPAATVSVLSGLGVLALRADQQTLERLTKARVLRIPGRSEWGGAELTLNADDETVDVEWLALGVEREWTSG